MVVRWRKKFLCKYLPLVETLWLLSFFIDKVHKYIPNQHQFYVVLLVIEWGAFWGIVFSWSTYFNVGIHASYGMMMWHIVVRYVSGVVKILIQSSMNFPGCVLMLDTEYTTFSNFIFCILLYYFLLMENFHHNFCTWMDFIVSSPYCTPQTGFRGIRKVGVRFPGFILQTP